MIDKLGLRNSVQEEERLKQLFQNRSGLKKAHADLQAEFHLLRDRLKQQEGATIRIQEQLDSLGDLLGDPQTGFGALVFFQLRTLWKTAHQQLAAFADDLSKQQEAREIAKHKADMVELHESRLRDVGERLEAAALRADEERERLGALQEKYNGLKAFWHYFNRRGLQRLIDDQRVQVAGADAAVGDLHAERSALEGEPASGFPGLTLEARRTINLAVIGYAEFLCERLTGDSLAARAKESMTRRVHEVTYGGHEACEKMMQEIQKGLAVVRNQGQVAVTVKSKIERFRAACSYRNSSDTVPTSDSVVEGVIDAAHKGEGKSTRHTSWNVLAEDYWDLYTLLLR